MKNWSGKAFIKIKGEDDTKYEDIFLTYGVCLKKGAYESLLEYPAPKSLITWSDRRNNGVEYLADSDTMRVDKKNVSISVLLMAENESDYYQKYEALFKRIKAGILFHKSRTRGQDLKLVHSKASKLRTRKKNKSM